MKHAILFEVENPLVKPWWDGCSICGSGCYDLNLVYSNMLPYNCYPLQEPDRKWSFMQWRRKTIKWSSALDNQICMFPTNQDLNFLPSFRVPALNEHWYFTFCDRYILYSLCAWTFSIHVSLCTAIKLHWALLMKEIFLIIPSHLYMHRNMHRLLRAMFHPAWCQSIANLSKILPYSLEAITIRWFILLLATVLVTCHQWLVASLHHLKAPTLKHVTFPAFLALL